MNYIRNMSLKKRLYFSLFLFIILPITIFGMVTYFYMGNLNRKEKYAQELESFKNSAKDIESILTYTENIGLSAVTANPIFRLVDGTANNKNYYDISNYFQDLMDRYPYYKNFTISSNKQIIFQRGVYIEKENHAFLNSAYESTYGHYWAPAHILPVPSTNYDTESGPVITYYSNIYDYYHDINQTVGMLSVSIQESALHTLYTTYLNPLSSTSKILKSDGTVMCSDNKQELGKKSDLYLINKDAMTGSSSYLILNGSDGKVLCYYYKSDISDFVFLNLVPYSAYGSLEMALAAILGVSLTICIFFGFMFSVLQKKYVVEPIGGLIQEIEKMKDGNFDLILPYESRDEIGQLSQDFIDMSERLKHLINEVYLGKIKQQEAEMAALVMQINPHFLYNTLDSIHWLAITEGAYDTSEQIEALSAIFRHVLSKGSDLVTIQSEVDFLQNYMFIMEKRYDSRVRLTVAIPEPLREYRILKLLIQPLVENSLLHGLEPKKEGGSIRITAYTDDCRLYIEVKDNGAGTDEHEIQKRLRSEAEDSSVFALRNIDDRIKLHYGEEFGLSFSSKKEVGTCVTLALPYEASNSILR